MYMYIQAGKILSALEKMSGPLTGELTMIHFKTRNGKCIYPHYANTNPARN